MSCPVPLQATVYNGRDNELEFPIFDSAGVVTDLSTVTRVTITIGTTTIDSDVVGSSVIWWTETASYRGATVDVLKMVLGGQGLAVAEYADCELVIYDADHTNGRRIENPIKIEVVA